jgi:crossover junction endodeoxyribonuclease RuvC
MNITTRRIIGLDPGLRSTGWGVIEITGSKLSYVAAGTVSSTLTKSLAERLVELEIGINQVFDAWRPDEAAVENSFVNRDGASTLKLGQARAISLLVPARLGLPVAEYAPNLVKKSVTGSGHAEKHQVEVMVRMLLPTARPETNHSADALAVAITHANIAKSPIANLQVVG